MNYRWSQITALAVLFLSTVLAFGQAKHGEVRLKITDPSGAGVRAAVELSSLGTGYDKILHGNADGTLSIQMVPFGLYELQVQQPGFAPFTETLEINSVLPIEKDIRLTVAPVNTEVNVAGADTLVDPSSPSTVMEIGSEQVRQRLSSLPGRSVQDLVITQPGWLYEGNAVLHPRGSEYQTQFLVDGIPLTDNRSPSFGPEIGADDIDSMSVYTAGYPAEFGRQMGGVVE